MATVNDLIYLCTDAEHTKLLYAYFESWSVVTTMSWLSNIKLPSWLQWPSRSTARHVLIGVLLGFSFSLVSNSFALYYYQRQRRRKDRLISDFTPRPIELRSDEVVKGVSGLIGML